MASIFAFCHVHQRFDSLTTKVVLTDQSSVQGQIQPTINVTIWKLWDYNGWFWKLEGFSVLSPGTSEWIVEIVLLYRRSHYVLRGSYSYNWHMFCIGLAPANLANYFTYTLREVAVPGLIKRLHQFFCYDYDCLRWPEDVAISPYVQFSAVFIYKVVSYQGSVLGMVGFSLPLRVLIRWPISII